MDILLFSRGENAACVHSSFREVGAECGQIVVKTDAKTIVKCKSFCGFITKRNDLPHFISFFMGSANSRAP